MKMYMSGSEAIAWGIKLARVKMVCAYPITPNTPALMAISDLISDGVLKAEQINAESELDAQNICAGAEAVGVRSFNCTNSQGFALMRQALWMTSGMALPVVLAVTSREIGAPQGLSCDFSDAMSERDSSLVQFYCETAQEVVDNLIMIYRICEDPKVLLPGIVVLEGFKHTHTYETVDLPDQGIIDQFLPSYQPKHAFVDPKYPIVQGSGVLATEHYDGFKYQQCQAQENAKEIIKTVCRDFAGLVGRDYGGLINTYKLVDADLALVTIGTTYGISRQAVDELRTKGIKAGALKIRSFRPFPEEELLATLARVKHVLVIDRASTPGNKGGILYLETCAALQETQGRVSNYKIGSRDIHVSDVIEMALAAHESQTHFVDWYKFSFDQRIAAPMGWDNFINLSQGKDVSRESELAVEGEGLIAPNTNLCQGCISMLAVKLAGMAFGPDTVLSFHGGCMGLACGVYPFTALRVPSFFMGFDGAGATESGMEVGLKIKDIKADVLMVGGDGGVMDIGLQTISSALERGHDITYFLYDNEAYMNTGVQRSSGTPYLASTKTTPKGKKEHKKDIMKIAEAHRGVYTATVSPAYPNDLMRKMKKARSFPGPAFIHAICPCPPGWEHSSEIGIEICRKAVETGSVVLYEYYEGKRVINRLPKKRKPIEEYLKLQGRFSHLTPQEIASIQAEVDRSFNRIVEEAEKGVKELELPGVSDA